MNVRELYNKIGPYTFNRLAHHLLIGRQVIVRGTSAHAVSTVVQSLQVGRLLGINLFHKCIMIAINHFRHADNVTTVVVHSETADYLCQVASL